jgi:hypothetical protein
MQPLVTVPDNEVVGLLVKMSTGAYPLVLDEKGPVRDKKYDVLE